MKKELLCGLNPADFEGTVEGKAVHLYILKNKKGAEAAICNYGGVMPALMMPDKNGHYASVVLGHDSLQHVIDSPECYLGTLIGRYGNRIANAEFELDGKIYKLAVNNGPNSLHGGTVGYNKRAWDAEQTDEHSVKLSLVSPDGEENFPGTLNIEVVYTLTDDNELRLDYKATTDKKTIINLTNHAFFNLAGIGTPTPSVYNHVLSMNADLYLPIDENSIPYGTLAEVEGTPFDFRTPHTIGERIDNKDCQLKNGAGYDHCFAIRQREFGSLTFAAECVDPNSGRCMKVYTTEPGVQLYTGNWLNGFEGAHKATFPARTALCFEAQRFPDTPNKGYYPSCILKPGEIYTQTTIYAFSVK